MKANDSCSMDSSEKARDGAAHPAARIFAACALLFATWLIPSAVVYYLGLALHGESIPRGVALISSLAFFTILASSLTANFVVAAERHAAELARQRLKLLFVNVLVFAALFLVSRAVGYPSPVVFILSTANLLVFASILGAWLVEPIRRPAELIVVCVIVSCADIFSVTSGPTHGMAREVAKYYAGDMKGNVPFADFLLFKYSIPGEQVPLPLFGVADWVIIAFLAAAALRLNINDSVLGPGIVTLSRMRGLAIYVPVTVLGLGLAMACAGALNTFLPALPFIAAFFVLHIIIRYPEARRLTRTDWLQVAVFSSVLGGLTVARLIGMF